ncbi:uncharacterized protein LOC132270871 isoform X2 [Cornus florida]|uniref:uncharacterized protein LOC132270871 isoform X2 n=1 Tax=Cornus florida TaxID=4283 RepID=UPI0028A0E5F1|nr:uncharacterized protein LOC132270871 isoform X2 [Cornus florida]
MQASGSFASLFEASRSVLQTSIKSKLSSTLSLSPPFFFFFFSLGPSPCEHIKLTWFHYLKSSPSNNKHSLTPPLSFQMADVSDKREFRLPSEFLSNEHMFMEKENFNKRGLSSAWSSFCFPTEFPYKFGSSSVLSSPVESVVGSTDPESDDDYWDFLHGLTRQLSHSTLQQTQNTKKTWVCPDSPQSTLAGIGSWSGPSAVSSNGSPKSPPTTPFTAPIEPWDLIYAVAGQFASLKTNGEGPPNARGLLGDPRALIPTTGFYSNHSLTPNFSEASHFNRVRQDQVLKQQYSSIWGRQAREGFSNHQISESREERLCGGFQSRWSPVCLQHQPRQNEQQLQCGSGKRGVFVGGGSGVKRKCAGTGVFLPRRYANPSNPSKNTGCSSALLPDRVVPALNNNTQPHPHFNTTFTSGYDDLRGQRNATLTQQKRSLGAERAVNHEVVLPQEWTY